MNIHNTSTTHSHALTPTHEYSHNTPLQTGDYIRWLEKNAHGHSEKILMDQNLGTTNDHKYNSTKASSTLPSPLMNAQPSAQWLLTHCKPHPTAEQKSQETNSVDMHCGTCPFPIHWGMYYPVNISNSNSGIFPLQCFDTVGWATGRASGL